MSEGNYASLEMRKILFESSSVDLAYNVLTMGIFEKCKF